MSFGSKDHQIHVHNTTSEPFYVAIAPNSDWETIDLGVEAVGALGSITSGALNLPGKFKTFDSIAKGAANLKDYIKLLSGLSIAWNEIKLARAAYKTNEVTRRNDAFKKQLEGQREAVTAFLRRKCEIVAPGQTRRVAKMNLPDKYFSVRGIAGLLGASDVTIFVVSESLDRVLNFNSNSDHSWIIQDDEVVRARFGTLQEPSRDDGYHRLSRGAALAAGTGLAPGQCLSSPNGKFDLVYQTDGNLVLYKRDKPAGGEATWSTRTHGNSAGSFTVTPGGDLVVTDADGKLLIALGDSGTDADHVDRYLALQDDGNLVLSTAKDKAVWDTMHDGDKFRLRR